MIKVHSWSVKLILADFEHEMLANTNTRTILLLHMIIWSFMLQGKEHLFDF